MYFVALHPPEVLCVRQNILYLTHLHLPCFSKLPGPPCTVPVQLSWWRCDHINIVVMYKSGGGLEVAMHAAYPLGPLVCSFAPSVPTVLHE